MDERNGNKFLIKISLSFFHRPSYILARIIHGSRSPTVNEFEVGEKMANS